MSCVMLAIGVLRERARPPIEAFRASSWPQILVGHEFHETFEAVAMAWRVPAKI